MILTLSTDHVPATDLGFVLHKNPSRLQEFELPCGRALVFYPEASPERCTVALVLDIDPVGLVRGKPGEAGTLDQYVNDRPYVASSFLSVALARVFSSAMGGRCPPRPELADMPWPLTIHLPVVPSASGEIFLRSLFEPLGYEVEATSLPLDAEVPEWGRSNYFDLTLRTVKRVADVLSHLYVLVPVLDDEKHYWVGDAEVDKLLKRGAGWLAGHPQRDAIAHRYLKRRRHLSSQALARLLDQECPDVEQRDARQEQAEAGLERPLGLNEIRLSTMAGRVAQSGATSVLDLGCGEGRLLQRLMENRQFTRLVGVDVSPRSLDRAADRLRLDELPQQQRERLQLLQGSLIYRDKRLVGFDAACLVEVIEHVDPVRLPALERAVFEFAHPGQVLVSTPNAEYNVLFPGLKTGDYRHPDHRFEWTRPQFHAWCEGIEQRFGYRVTYEPIGPVHDQFGPPTQMAVLSAR